MQKQFLLSIFFTALSSPLFILSADNEKKISDNVDPNGYLEQESEKKIRNTHELEELIIIAKKKAYDAVSAKKSFESFAENIKNNPARTLYRVRKDGSCEKTTLNNKNIKKLNEKILKLKDIADLLCWKLDILEAMLSSIKNPSFCRIKSSLKLHEKIIAPPSKTTTTTYIKNMSSI